MTSSLDFERTDLYDFNVTATNDAGSVVFTSTSSVRINVLDVNDNAPVYGQVDYSVEINEGDYATSPEILSVNVSVVLVWSAYSGGPVCSNSGCIIEGGLLTQVQTHAMETLGPINLAVL